MKRLLLSTLSVAAGLGMATPAFAYIVKNENIEVQTSMYHNDRPSAREVKSTAERLNRPTVGARRTHYSSTEREVAPVRTNTTILENTGGAYNRLRTAPMKDTTGRSELERNTRLRLLRRFNRMPKAEDEELNRYRILDLRPNTRYLREKVESSESSFLPSSLVQTGGNSSLSGDWGYDRPTRRDIRENSLTNVDDRNRNVLVEIKNSTRSN